MYWVAGVFAASLAAALLMTPLAGRFGQAFGFMDAPQERKVHTLPIPRCGGLALFVGFFVAVALAWFSGEPQTLRFLGDRNTWAVFGGGLFIFLVGLVDDHRPLPAKLKLLAQVVAASACYFSGVRIGSFNLGDLISLDFEFFHHVFILGRLVLDFELCSYVLTVGWFVLFINAINIIDGLDGLATGVVLFVCAVQAVLAIMRQDMGTAMFFAAMAGACLGFLRYNFNPASIFLGDGGSYFLGYMVAALSIQSSVKSQVGATILMPILAFGVPLLDTITSPLRRFLRGQNIFEPDRKHVHHNLLARGWSQRKAVVFLYGVTVFLAVMAVLIVNMRNVPAGIFILLLGGALFLFVRKAGYFSYFAMDKVFGWIRDISDEAGMSHGRRTFLNLQIEISQSTTQEALWENITEALAKLGFDLAEMVITPATRIHGGLAPVEPKEQAALQGSCQGVGQGNGQNSVHCSDRIIFEWSRPELDRDRKDYLTFGNLLKLELPLMDSHGDPMGALWLVKSMEDDPQSDFTLRRVEQLRRSVVGTLERLLGRSTGGKSGPSSPS